MKRPPPKNNYETLIQNHADSRTSNKKVVSKSTARSKSKSAQKGLNTTVSGAENNYTPLRNSPYKSKSNFKSKPVRSKKPSNHSSEFAEIKTPTHMHENVMASLKREKDSLSLALNSEKNTRRILENENEELRRQIKEYERELRNAGHVKGLLAE